jgi:hypothetical protein
MADRGHEPPIMAPIWSAGHHDPSLHRLFTGPTSSRSTAAPRGERTDAVSVDA